MGKKGLGTLVKSTSGVWMVRTVVNGQVTTKSTKTKNKKEAQSFQRKLAKEKNDDNSRTIEENIKYHREMLNYYISLQQRKEIKLDDMFDAFKNHPETNCAKGTLRVYKTSISAFVEYLKTNYPKVEMLREVSDEMVKEWITELKEKLSANTVALRVTMIQHSLKVLLGDNPMFHNLKVSKNRPAERKMFTSQEVKSILESARNAGLDMRVLFNLGFYCGMRRSDCAKMRWGNVDFQKGVIQYLPIKTQKGGKVVSIPIHPELLKVLNAVKPDGELNPEDFISSKNARQYGTHRLTEKINKVLKNAGLEPSPTLNFHNLRHTFCAMNANNGTSQLALQSMLGHSTLEMTSNYYHKDNELVRQQLNQVLSLD